MLNQTFIRSCLSFLFLAVSPVMAGALLEVDLASDSAWTLSVDGGPPRSIKVPAGGYNSDRQDPPRIQMDVQLHDKTVKPLKRDVKDHATYERKLVIPPEAAGRQILVEFGAVNHGAEVFLDDGRNETLVGRHTGPMMPFAVDLTAQVQAGKEYGLKVKTYPLWHYTNQVPVGFIYGEGWQPDEEGWNSKFGFGITKYVRLAVYPQVRIRDVFVRTSVSQARLSADLWVRNDTRQPAEVALEAALDSFNGDRWPYPAVPGCKALVAPGAEAKLTVGPVPWTLGPGSYWWPNKPFREDYAAKLHHLKLTLKVEGRVTDQRTQRFGFVEWGEGPFFYTVNGVRINSIGDGTPESGMSEYDCYSLSPAFLPPTAPGTGCPETWRRYLRMGIGAYRTHQATPTPYMMEVADELGFMLIPETAIRGCQGQRWHDEYLPASVRELAQLCRNHPSVCRYSLQNEAKPAWVGPLADAIREVDAVRPLVFEDCWQQKPGRVTGAGGAYAFPMIHYEDHPRPAHSLCGVGESDWLGDQQATLQGFAYNARDGRLWDAAYYAGWDWMNYWPNFLEGMEARKHAWKQSFYGRDRQDGIDGWNSPLIRWVQKCFDPYLVVDQEFARLNGPFGADWPRIVPACRPGERMVRSLQLFNDGLTEAALTVRWSAHWDSLSGEAFASGELTGPVLKAGFHTGRTLDFQAPATARRRPVAIRLEVVKDGAVVFTDDQVRLAIDPDLQPGSARFLEADARTQGAWPGKYGALAHEVVGTKTAGGASALRVDWREGGELAYAPVSGDPRALVIAPQKPGERIAAVRHGKTVKFNVDVGPKPVKLSLYMMDWEFQELGESARSQEIWVLDEGGRLLDQRFVGNVNAGSWFSWAVSGRIRFEIRNTVRPEILRTQEPKAVVNGVFLDPIEK